MAVAGNMVPGEPSFYQQSGENLLQCESIDTDGAKAMALKTKGSFKMDTTQLTGGDGAPLQAVVSSSNLHFNR